MPEGRRIFAELTPWQKVQLSRHPARPYTLDFIERLVPDFIELHGDRRFADDASVVAGVSRMTRSYCSENEVSTTSKTGRPSNSCGLGGRSPAGNTNNRSCGCMRATISRPARPVNRADNPTELFILKR